MSLFFLTGFVDVLFSLSPSRQWQSDGWLEAKVKRIIPGRRTQKVFEARRNHLSGDAPVPHLRQSG